MKISPLFAIITVGAFVAMQAAEPRSATRRSARVASSTNSVPAAATGELGYPAFKTISDNNIFDTGRSRRSAGDRGERRAPVRSDSFTLVGILSYDKGPYAFFDGTSSEFRKVLEPGKTIAGCKIAAISPSAVQIETGTNTVELFVGMGLRREDEADWRVTGERKLASSSSLGSAGSSSSESSDDSDIVKRLMQQREQELK